MDPPPSSNCPDCKSVSGSGPLAGEYFLVEGKNQESLCLNNCVYMKKGDDDEDWYCFIKQDGPYTTTDCEKILPSTVAPFMKVFSNMIEENGEVIEQVDQYNNMTGEVSIKVPPHGNREPLQILMDPNKVKVFSFSFSPFVIFFNRIKLCQALYPSARSNLCQMKWILAAWQVPKMKWILAMRL